MLTPVIDTSKEYGLVLEGGGAKGAYQIGAWKALKEAGVKINAVAGTSVGALNGALICMDELEMAQQMWSNLTYSQVMDVDDTRMEQLMEGEAEAILKVQQANADGIRFLKEAGADESVLTLKSLEALKDMAEGKATKIIVPSDLQGLAGLATSLKEIMTDKNIEKK